MRMKTVMAIATALVGMAAVAGDDLAACRAAKERADAEGMSMNSAKPKLAAAKTASASAAADASGWKTYEFTASGDLNDVVGSGTLDFAFTVDVSFTEIKSATLTMNAWDVDYPEADEHDTVHFNGTKLGRLQGGNNSYHVNTYSLPNPMSLIKYPKASGSSAQNTFYIAVDIDDGGWVTGISWAKLTIVGKEGIVVNATDGLGGDGAKYPEGIFVSWTKIENAVYDVYRSEKVGELGNKIVSQCTDTSCYDKVDDSQTSVRPDVVYYYTVKTNTGTEGSDDGLYDATLPEVTKLEFPGFWLEDNSPFKYTFNKFNENVYEVTKVSVSIAHEGSTDTFDLANDGWESESCCLKFMDEEANWNHDVFGEFEVSVTWCVKNKITGEEMNDGNPYGPDNAKGIIQLYFNKYKLNGSVPNWYVFWPKMGAISAEYFGTDAFSYQSNSSNVAGGHMGGWFRDEVTYVDLENGGVEKDVVVPNGYPSVFVLRGATHSYSVSNLSVAQNDEHTVNGKVVGNTSVGLECLASTISHELRHGELWDDLVAKPGTVLIGQFQTNSGFSSVDDLIDVMERNGINESNTPYYNAILRAYQGGSGDYVSDLDGDLLSDSDEINRYGASWNFRVDNPDTHNFNSIISGYSAYGDNEVLAREAELSPVPTNPEKDWAFPGSRLAAEGAGLTEDDWDFSPWCQYADRMFQAFTAAQGSSLVASSVRLKTLAINTLLKDSGELYYNEINHDCPGAYVVGGVVACSALPYSSGTKYDALSLTVIITNRLSLAREVSIKGNLILEDGTPVAWASRSSTLLQPGKNDVTLIFDGTAIRKVKGAGYQLSVAINDTSRGDNVILSCAKTGLKINSDFASTEFTCNGACIIRNVFSDSTADGNLVLKTIVDVADSRTYSIIAQIEDSDGTFVAMAKEDGISGVGSHEMELSFSGSSIYLSRCNGPYHVVCVRLQSGNEVEESLRNVYITKSYMYNDFKPSDLSLQIDDQTFVHGANIVGADGLITRMPFSFTLRNTGKTTTGRVKLFLSATNGLLVCTSECNATFVAGANKITIDIDCDDIAKRGVEGPYIVSEVLITPKDGCSYRFFPNMDPIDLNPEDFGVYPFELAGEPTVAESSGSSAYAVTVPINVLRPNTVTISALLIDGDGKYVATAKKSVKYEAATTSNVTIEFSSADIAESGRRGPYTIRYLNISSDLEGIEPLRVTSFKEEGLVRDYVLYVDADANDDSGDGLSWTTAKRTIQAAVDEAQDGDVIQVADGTYEPFTCDNKAIQIVGVYGYENTFVDGGSSNRCATLGREESQTNTVLKGFTLKNGDATTDNVLLLWNCGGGVCCGTVFDCAITDCTASKGGGAYYGRLESCLITDNEATTYGGGSYYGERVNCTICGNNGKTDAGGTYYGVTHNSIVWNNTRGSSGSYDDNWCGGAFAHSVTTPLPDGTGNLSDDPGFVDAENGDYGLKRDSVCLDAGDDAMVIGDEDLVGYARIMGNAVDIGAFERWQRKRTYGVAEFAAFGYAANEGGAFEVEVWGGKPDCATSVDVYISYAMASAKDIDLSKGAIDGVTPKGGLKFPLNLKWDAGDTTAKVITIPVKTDKDIEGYESLWLQMASPSGIAFGEAATCTLTIEDESVPSAIGLPQAVNNPSLRASTSGAGKWTVGDDAEFWAADRGIYNAVSPALAKGKSSTLALSGVSGKGAFVAVFHFEGDEEDDSTLSIYAGKSHMKTYTHSSVGSQWQRFTINDENKGAHTYSYVFTQGSDANSKVKMAYAYWVPDGKSEPVMVYVTTGVGGGGYVSGMGYYTVGTTAKPVATAYPGYEFDAWYAWSNDESKYVEYSRNAKLTLKVTSTMDLMAVFNSIPYAGAVADPANAGKVSGLGYCADGKKVTLKATANKGFVFMGWESGGKIISKAPALLIDRSKKPAKDSATQTVITDFSYTTTYRAKFITVEEDMASIAAGVNGVTLAPWESKTATHAYATNVWTGVYLEWPVAANALSETTVKVAGLPSGLKFAAKDVTQKVGSGKTAQTIVVVPANTIYGAPSAASKVGKPSEVKLTVTTAGKSSQTYQIDTTVDPLPSWAQGTFTGPSYEGEVTNGLATVTIASSGKISAKQPVNGKSASFAASYFDGYGADEPAFYATLTAKVGKEVVTNEIAVSPAEIALSETTVTNGFIESELFDAWQYNWKAEPWKTAAKGLDDRLDGESKEYFICQDGTCVHNGGGGATLIHTFGEDGIVGRVTLKYAASGAVTVKGLFVQLDSEGTPIYKSGKLATYQASANTTLVPSGDGYLVFVYFAPNAAKGFPGHVRCVEVE